MNKSQLPQILNKYNGAVSYVRFSSVVLPPTKIKNLKDFPKILDDLETRIKLANNSKCAWGRGGSSSKASGSFSKLGSSLWSGQNSLSTKYSDSVIESEVMNHFDVRSVAESTDGWDKMTVVQQQDLIDISRFAIIEYLKMYRDACSSHSIDSLEETMALFYAPENKFNCYFRGQTYKVMNEISQYYNFNLNISPKQLAINITKILYPDFNAEDLDNLYINNKALSSDTNLIKHTNEIIDAIVLARQNPSLIVVLTCDQKWSEVEHELNLQGLTLKGIRPQQVNSDLVLIDFTDNTYSVRDQKTTFPGESNLEYNSSKTYNLGYVTKNRKAIYYSIWQQDAINKHQAVLNDNKASFEEQEYSRQQIKSLSSSNNSFNMNIHPKIKGAACFSIITSDDYKPIASIIETIDDN